jgi:hypothetical protein
MGHDALDVRVYNDLRDWQLPYFYGNKRRGYPGNEYKKRLNAYDNDRLGLYWL